MWITTNIEERAKNRTEKFITSFNPTKFQIMEFNEAAEKTVLDICEKYKQYKYYLSLSGGADSEFILLLFRKLGIDVTPIIVKTPYNVSERQYAFHICKKLSIEPKVIEADLNLLINIYRRDLVVRFNGMGFPAIPCIIAANYAIKNGGIIITGDHLINDSDGKEIVEDLESNIYDHYTTALYPDRAVSFFIHNPEICYAIIKTLKVGENIAEWKHKLYGTAFRPKIRYNFDRTAFREMAMVELTSGLTPYQVEPLPSIENFLKMMESWNK